MYTCYIQSCKILASFCSWAGWFESYLVENPHRHIFVWCGSVWSVSKVCPDLSIWSHCRLNLQSPVPGLQHQKQKLYVIPTDATGPCNLLLKVNILKFWRPKKKEPSNFISLLIIEAKGSNKFCKGRQFNCLPLQNWSFPSQNFWYFPFWIKVLLYEI